MVSVAAVAAQPARIRNGMQRVAGLVIPCVNVTAVARRAEAA